MGKGWRAWIAWAMVLTGIGVLRASSAEPVDFRNSTTAGPIVRSTIDVEWSDSADRDDLDVILGLTEGRITGATGIGTPNEPNAVPLSDGTWRIGRTGTGKVRARVEAPLGTIVVVRTGAQEVRVPMVRLLDGPQHTVPPATIDVTLSRPTWDAIEIEAGGFDGVAAPGAKIPIRIGLNILSIDASEVDLRFSVEVRPIRGGPAVWRHDQRAVIATDTITPPSWVLEVEAPPTEGVYSLEVRTTLEPITTADGSRLGRLLRRRRTAPAVASPATRRTTFAVLDPKGKPWTEPPGRVETEETVDTIDLSRPRGHRASASGRALGVQGVWRIPEGALVEETRRDRLRGWIARGLGEAVVLGPADAAGVVWSAIGLKAPHPDRLHRLTLTVNGGHPSSLGVGLITTGGPGRQPRIVLDACASGPPVIEGNQPQTYSWLVWPEAAEPVLVIMNRDRTSPVHLGTVTLAELPDTESRPPILLPKEGLGRSVGIDLTDPATLGRFGGNGDPIVAGRNLARYLALCGANAVILSDALADRRARLGLDRQADEDSIGPDRLELELAILERLGVSVWVDLRAATPLPDLPALDSPEALAEGIVRVDRSGKADGASYHLLHPKVRQAFALRVAEIASAGKSRTNFAGVSIRLGPGSTVLGRPDTGMDDATFAQFVAAMFDPSLAKGIPGLGTEAPDRFEARADFLEGAGQKPWLTWRARELASVYAELAGAVKTAVPGARLAVSTPDLDGGAVGDEIRRLDRVGLGPLQAWRSVGVDLTTWPTGDDAPIVLRGVGLSQDPLARDIASDPELDGGVAERPARGLWLSLPPRSVATDQLALVAVPSPSGESGDETFGHALAAIDGQWFFASAFAVAGREDRFRRFTQVVRSLPPPARGPALPRPSTGVTARLVPWRNESYLGLANDTPYPIRLETRVVAPDGTTITDLAQSSTPIAAEPIPGGLRVVVDLPPFGVAAAKIGSPDALVQAVAPRPGPAVLDGMKAQYDDLTVTLARLNRLAAGTYGSGPSNPDFEAPPLPLNPSRPVSPILGWRVLGDPKATLALDFESPHAGRAAARFEAPSLPASLISDPFTPEGHPSVTIHAWMRSERPETRVRLWLEGQAAGRPFARQLELSARPEWTASAVRASGIPETGLESARLRFEMLGPGRLWLDDLSVSGPALTEPERLNARRDLMAALSAYRDNRYADFARLAGSHWTRQVASEPAATGRLAGDRSGLIRTGDIAPTALPANRRTR